ncbi:MAG: hypothetical protein NT107_04490 [Planctomycetota bacterium]|jgi:hypothetical protein|nr:hypothetical protein [Planctomycetota bacterium]
MGEGKLFAAGTALILSACVFAQGPIYRERWSFMHLQLLRQHVQRECEGRDPVMMAKVASALLAPDQGIPFRPAAKALALLRSVDCDEAFLLRAMITAFMLPEVVDPTVPAGLDIADCRSLNMSLCLPYSVPLPGKVTFAIEVFDRAGAKVFGGMVEDATSLDDLRMARATCQIKGSDLSDGRYQMRVRTLLDGKEPREKDPVLEHRFFVLRGYKVRADVARDKAEKLRGKLDETRDAFMQGLLLEVNRAYAGAAFDGVSDAVADLERLEYALSQLDQNLAPWDGMKGDIPIGLPGGGGQPVSAVIRMNAGNVLRPVLCFIGSSPSYDMSGLRPAEPTYESGRCVAQRLGDFGLGAQCQIAWLQSPSSTLSYKDALPNVLRALRQILPCDGRVLLVLEYEAAVVMSFTGDLLMQESVGTVLVGAGAYSAAMLQKLGSLRMLGVPMTMSKADQTLQRSAAVAAGKFGPVDWQGRFDVAAEAPRPWTLGAAAAKPEIAAFARDVLQLPK